MAEELPLSEPLPLSAAHDLSGFDCGALALNDYLRKYAYANQQANAARTYVTVRGNQVAGYYTLAAGAVRREETTGRVSTGLARHPVPIILLARLAIDLNEQGKGIGVALLKDALLRSARAADLIGCRAVPLCCGGELFGHPLPGAVQVPEADLRRSKSGSGCPAEPERGLSIVAAQAFPSEQQVAEACLRHKLLLLSSFSVPLGG